MPAVIPAEQYDQDTRIEATRNPNLPGPLLRIAGGVLERVKGMPPNTRAKAARLLSTFGLRALNAIPEHEKELVTQGILHDFNRRYNGSLTIQPGTNCEQLITTAQPSIEMAINRGHVEPDSFVILDLDGVVLFNWLNLEDALTSLHGYINNFGDTQPIAGETSLARVERFLANRECAQIAEMLDLRSMARILDNGADITIATARFLDVNGEEWFGTNQLRNLISILFEDRITFIPHAQRHHGGNPGNISILDEAVKQYIDNNAEEFLSGKKKVSITLISDILSRDLSYTATTTRSDKGGEGEYLAHAVEVARQRLDERQMENILPTPKYVSITKFAR